MVAAAAALVMCACGGASYDNPEAAARAWGEAINDREWVRACELMDPRQDDCERTLREQLGDTTLTFDGRAIGGPREGAYYSFGSDIGSVFATAVRRDGGYRLHYEALILR